MLRLRSCASSTMIVSYAASSGSPMRLREQDAVGHQLDERVGLRVVGEPHLVADGLAERRAELVRDPRRDRARGDAPRLRVADEPALAAPEREADLRQLRRLAGTGLAADDHHRVCRDGRGDLVGALRDRKLGGIGDRRPPRGPRPTALDRARDGRRDPVPLGAGPAGQRRARSIRRASSAASAAIVSGSCAMRRAA